MTAEWVRVDLDVVEKYGADAAVVLGLIAYRCNLTGEWTAAVDDVVAETRLTTHRVRTALRSLRESGAVESHRADRFQPTLTWRVSPGHTVNQESLITSLRNPSLPETQESCITSTTEEQELPLVVPSPTTPSKKASRATRLPAGFGPSPAHWALAAQLGVDLTHEGPQFVDHHTAKGSTFKDWDAALRTWIRNAARYAAQRAGTEPGEPRSTWAGDSGPVSLPAPKTDPFAARSGW